MSLFDENDFGKSYLVLHEMHKNCYFEQSLARFVWTGVATALISFLGNEDKINVYLLMIKGASCQV